MYTSRFCSRLFNRFWKLVSNKVRTGIIYDTKLLHYFCLVILLKILNNIICMYRFSNDPNIKEKWIDATGQKDWFPTTYSRICSDHFNDGSFRQTKICPRLTLNAIPTLNIKYNSCKWLLYIVKKYNTRISFRVIYRDN